MPTTQLNLQQQLAVCRQVARLVRAKLPIAGELAAQLSQPASIHADSAKIVESQIAAGKSLSQAVAGDESRDSKILAACIEAGELAGSLDQALEAWSSMHIANSKSSKAMRIAMLYPCMLMAVAVVALTFVAWLIIPQYRATYEMFDQRMPAWLETISWIRQHQWLVVVVVLLLSAMPLLVWTIRRRQVDRAGLPRDPARRSRLQGLSTEIAAIMLDGFVPLTKTASLAVQAGGGNAEDAKQAFTRLQRQQPISPLAPEAAMLLASLHAGLIAPDETAVKLHQVAGHLRSQADIRVRQQAHWIPMLVALSVGLATIVTYVFLIYLPWIWLLRKIVTPNTITGL